MIRCDVTVTNKTGLHARPAGEFAKAASAFKSDIIIEFKDKKLNAKSILNIMAAGINCGSTIGIAAEGIDEKEAVKKLVELLETKFGE